MYVYGIVMCMAQFFLPYRLHISLSILSIFMFILSNNDRSLIRFLQFLRIIKTDIYLLSMFSSQLSIYSSQNLKSFLHSKLFTANFCNIAYPYRSITSQYMRYEDSLLGSQSLMNLLFSFPHSCMVWYIPLLIAYQHLFVQ